MSSPRSLSSSSTANSGGMSNGRRFLVFKRSLLKGRYARVLEVSATGFKSFDPTKGLSLTNEWNWEQIIGCEADVDGFSLSIHGKTGIFSSGGPEKVMFEAETAQALGCILQESASYRGFKEWATFEGHKVSASKRSLKAVKLLINPQYLSISNASSGKVESEYSISSITQIGCCSDGLYVEVNKERVHCFQMKKYAEFFEDFTRICTSLRLIVQRKDITGRSVTEFAEGKIKALRGAESVRDVYWYSVMCDKQSAKYAVVQKRRLSLFCSPCEVCETDESTAPFRCISVRSIYQLQSLTCPSDQPTAIILNFKDGSFRQYSTSSRDELACAILDLAANESMHLALYTSGASTKYCFYSAPSSTDSSTLIAFQSLVSSIRLLNSERSDSSALVRAFAEFNANANAEEIASLNLNLADKSEMLTVAVAFANELLERPKVPQRALAEMLQTISRVSWLCVLNNKGELLRLGTACLKKGDDFVVRGWFQTLYAFSSADYHQESAAAYSNRQALFASLEPYQSFLQNCLNDTTSSGGIIRGSIALTSFVRFVLEPLLVTQRHVTPPDVYNNLLQMLLSSPRTTIKLLDLTRTLPNYSQQITLIFSRLFEMDAFEEAESEIAEKSFAKLETEALTSGHFLEVFRNALFSESKIKVMTCRMLLSMFCSMSKEVLIRLVPSGLIHALDVPPLDSAALKMMMEQDKMEDVKFRGRINEAEKIQRCGVPPRHSLVELKKNKRNFPVFFHLIQQDHSLPDLIWNEATRNDLKASLDKELSEFTFSDKFAWNYSEFEVDYVSLSREILLGDCYVRLLLDEDEVNAHKLVKQIREPLRFFNSLFHHLLRSSSNEQWVECLRALRLVQTVHGHTFVGGFSECPTIADIANSTDNRLVRDHALLLLRALSDDVLNVRILMRSSCTIDVAISNLSRIHSKNKSNVDENLTSKEWYVKLEESETRVGPLSLSELKSFILGKEDPKLATTAKFWAIGFGKDWKRAKEIPQLRDEFLMHGESHVDSQTVAIACLEILTRFAKSVSPIDSEGRWLRPPPKAFRALSAKDNLHHIANTLCARQYPRVVDAAATLLSLLGHVPDLVRKLYLTGAFYFALSYRGSNFDGISKFLFATHLEQHFSEEAMNSQASSLKKRSILGDTLPEALLYVLAHSGESFKQVFIGSDSDTPELIWTGEMRRSLIESLESHLDGFLIRLSENFCARYDFVPVPPLTYLRLEKETYCSRYFLGNLCDRSRFPSWPIADPVALFKSLLDVWRKEVDQRDHALRLFTNKAEALKVLEIEAVEGVDVTLDEIKKAWRKLARQYHPDRNPSGKERFELIEAAYNQLTAPRAEYHFQKAIDPVTLDCVLDCQILVLERFSDVLADFRYPGFGLLLDLMENFAKQIVGVENPSTLDENEKKLLATSSRLLYRVCWVSHHNGQELIQHIPRISKLVLLFASFANSSYIDLLRVIAGLCALSEEARDKISTDTLLIDNMCSLPRKGEECMQIPDAVNAVFRAAQSDVGKVMLNHEEFPKALAVWLLHYDVTWKPDTEKDDSQYLENLAGQAQSAIFTTVAKSVALVILKHKESIKFLPRSVLSLLRGRSSVEKFLSGLSMGSFQLLTVLWTPACVSELKAFSVSDRSVRNEVEYESLRNELVVGDQFYVRVYVEQKCRSEPGFPKAVISYIETHCSISPLGEGPMKLALEAFLQLVDSTESLDIVELVEAFDVKFARILLLSKMEMYVAEILNRHNNIVIAVVMTALSSLKNEENFDLLALGSELFESISKTNPGSQYLTALSNVPLLFNLFSRSILRNDNTVALTALSNISWNASAKEAFLVTMSRWIPRTLAEMISNRDQFLSTINQPSIETARLIWNSDAKVELIEFLKQGDYEKRLVYSGFGNERMIGGVYLRVFLKDPNNEFDAPEVFLEKLMESLIGECVTRTHGRRSDRIQHTQEIVASYLEDDPILTPLSSAVVALLVSRPNLCTHVSVWGNCAALLKIITTASIISHELANCLRVIRVMCTDPRCLRSFTDLQEENRNYAEALVSLIEQDSDSDVGSTCAEIIKTALDCSDMESAKGFASLLLDKGFDVAIRLVKVVANSNENSKHRVNSIEALRTLEARFGNAELSEALEKQHPNWSKIRVQRHDLFLTQQDERSSQLFLLKGPAEAHKANEPLLFLRDESEQPDRTASNIVDDDMITPPL